MKSLQILFYTTPQSSALIDVIFEDESLWLPQKKMAELFGVEANTINYHLKEIFKSGELAENSVIRIFRTIAADGKNYNTQWTHQPRSGPATRGKRIRYFPPATGRHV